MLMKHRPNGKPDYVTEVLPTVVEKTDGIAWHLVQSRIMEVIDALVGWPNLKLLPLQPPLPSRKNGQCS